MDLEPARESFILYAKWYTCISAFSAKAQGLAFKAICEYALFDVPIPKVGFSHLEYNSLISFLPVIDSNRRRYENGKKGAVHGFKGGRPRKDVALKTPNEPPNEPPNETPNKTPNGNDGNVTVESKIQNDVDVGDTDSPPTTYDYKYLYDLLLPIFFFKNCAAEKELKKFHRHYELSDWRLSGGQLLDTPRRLVVAAERWQAKDASPVFPAYFINFWKAVYALVPSHLQIDAVLIRSNLRQADRISIGVSQALHSWLFSAETQPQISHLIYTLISPHFRLEFFVDKRQK